MFVGEAPGGTEDRDGLPLAGASGRLLEDLLAGIGLGIGAVAVVNVVNCRPPDNRNPLPGEIEHCREYLHGQIELREPVVVCPLGSFAARVLRGKSEPISGLRGQAEVRTVGARTVRLLPLLHPAAALYCEGGVEQLRADMGLIPGLVALGAPAQAPVGEPVPGQPALLPEPEPEAEAEAAADPAPEVDPAGEQLGLF